jgi:hypothetical protein
MPMPVNGLRDKVMKFTFGGDQWITVKLMASSTSLMMQQLKLWYKSSYLLFSLHFPIKNQNRTFCPFSQ